MEALREPLPGNRLQVDVKFIEPIGGAANKHYQFTAIDDCTRIRVLRIYPRNNQKTAIQFLDYALEKLPFGVEVRPDRQRGRVPGCLSLARPGPRDRPCLHQAPNAATQRQGGEIAPNRQRGGRH